MKKYIVLITAVLMCLVPLTAQAEEVTEESGLTVGEVEEILPETLKEYAEIFCEEEQEHGINLLFVAAVAQQETQSGTTGVGKSKNNLFGNRGKNGFMRFADFEESIRYQFDMLERLYISKGRTTVTEISKIYCEPPEYWADAVNSIYEGYEEKAEELNTVFSHCPYCGTKMYRRE